MKSLNRFVFVILSGLVAAVALPSYATSPSSGATVQSHRAAVDGAGVQFGSNSDLGWKVWDQDNSTQASLVLDENSVAPACGIVGMVCVSTGTAGEAVQVYDTSATAASYGTATINAGHALSAPLVANTSTMTCTPRLEVQFYRGLVISNGGSDLNSVVLWRPCRGGQN